MLEQARNWLQHANLIAVATPWARSSDTARLVCELLGPGWLVGPVEPRAAEVHEGCHPRCAGACLRPNRSSN